MFGVMVMDNNDIENFQHAENKVSDILSKLETLSKGLHFHINSSGQEIIEEIRKDLRVLRSGLLKFRWNVDSLKENINKITRTDR